MGQFCFSRLPFGLCTAPATFQSLMHKIFENLLYKSVIIYLDDILLYSKNEEDHTKLLEVFSRIQSSGLKINPGKCISLSFLGHVISPKGIETNNDKISKVKNAPIPNCVTQVRSFLGLCNYYLRFIRDYALIAAPLYALTKNMNDKFEWSSACNQSFEVLKGKLSSSPILAFPDPTKNMILDTDASFGAIGAVLSQINDKGDEEVIAYGSRVLTDHEKGYCVTRKELLALHEFIMYFKHYLLGKKVLARTDHKALTYMINTHKPISPQFQTWFTNLSGFNFDLEYRKGSEHGNADGLSRISDSLCFQCLSKHEDAKGEKPRTRYLNVMDNLRSDDEMKKILNEDPIIFSIFNWLKGNDLDVSANVKKSRYFKELTHYELEGDIVMYRKNDQRLILIPESYSFKLISYMHEELCHLGSKKLLDYISGIYFWPNMTRSIEHEIKKCIICSKRKTYTGKTKEFFIPREEFGPLEQVVMDIAYFTDENVKHRYLLVLIDRFSKLVSLIPMVRQDEKTVAQNILYHWIYKFGKPKSFLSDRGKVFEGKEMKMLANKFGIEQEFSSPYQHQSNGLAERTIRTVRDMLVTSKIGENSKNQWTGWIPKIEFYINATYQSSTGRSPFEIIYGRKLLLHGQFQDSKIDHSGSIAKTEFSNKKTADKLRSLDRSKRGERVFHIGEEVMVKIEPHKAKKDGFRYEGPYKILEFISPHQVLIDFPGHPKPRRIDWLKKKQDD